MVSSLLDVKYECHRHEIMGKWGSRYLELDSLVLIRIGSGILPSENMHVVSYNILITLYPDLWKFSGVQHKECSSKEEKLTWPSKRRDGASIWHEGEEIRELWKGFPEARPSSTHHRICARWDEKILSCHPLLGMFQKQCRSSTACSYLRTPLRSGMSGSIEGSRGSK